MSPINQLELQKALRDNSEDMTTNYRELKKWEQDIKKKELKIKNNRAESEDEPLITKNETVTCDQTLTRAEIYNAEGKNFVKSKDYVKAHTFYTKAIAEDPSNPKFYNNRAFCSLNMKNYSQVIEDCNLALQLDPKLTKAYYRRMEANDIFQNYKLALEDARKLIQLQPNETKFKEKFDCIQQKVVDSVKERAQPVLTRPMANRDYISTLNGMGTDIAFFNKVAHLRSKQPLKRVRITSVHSTEAITTTTTNSAPTKLDSNGNAPAEVITEVKQSVPSTTKVSSTTVTGDATTLCPSPPDNSVLFDFIEKNNHHQSQEPSERPRTVESNGNAGHSASSTVLNPSTPSTPSSSSQFYSAWKTLGSAANRFAYLKNINAVRLNDLLGCQFDVVVLSELLEVLAHHFVPNGLPALPYLQQIAMNQQMHIIKMFMNTADRTACQRVIDYINESHIAEMKRLKGTFFM